MIMNKILDKTPLKSRTAWSHLRTLKQASEVVSSWPEWKRHFKGRGCHFGG